VHRYIGYCTNVHAGTTLEQIKNNLDRHALAVKEQVSASSTMGIGLWLPASVAQQVWKEDRATGLADYLNSKGLLSFTLNGFPYGDFHQDVVKHDVYLPTWFEKERLEYTLLLTKILHAILPEGIEGSISTLPLAWGKPAMHDDELMAAGSQLLTLAQHLRQLEEESGRLIYLCIEPEPGCSIQRSSDVIEFFQGYLLRSNEKLVRRYLRICHDVCHAAVMFEPQRDVIQRYRDAGILVGKVQISSAVRLRLGELSNRLRQEALGQLTGFAEDRYLHQTVVRTRDGRELFFEDLPLALARSQSDELQNGEWRVHFHVPIYLDQFGHIETSRSDIDECLKATLPSEELTHYEVETYAWNVLPKALQQRTLADGIAKEVLSLQSSVFRKN